jgi:hypothetical protein
MIAFVLLIANPLSLWSGTHEEEALRIEKARERNWSAQYRTSPPALMELYVYDGAKTDADIDFITTCPKLWKLTITLPEKDLGKLTRLTRLEELNLWKSSFQGDGLTRLSGMTNLHTLKINYCKLSAKGYESLGSLDHIKTLEINPRDLLDFRNLNSLSQMKSLQTIAIEEAYLWDLSKLERQQLAKDLVRLNVKVVNRTFYGDPLDVANADPPPARLFYTARYSPLQMNVVITTWRLIPWLSLFLLVVIAVSMYIWCSRAPWAIRTCSYLPRFALFGYLITLGFTLIVLTVLIPRRTYQAQMRGGDFWEMIYKGIGQTNGVHKLPALLVGDKHCFFLISVGGHGDSTLCAIPNQEVIEHFPKFLEKALQDEKVSNLQLETLLDRTVSASNRLDVIYQLKEKGAQPLMRPRVIMLYLATLELEKWASTDGHNRSQEFAERLKLEKCVADWENRTARYWATVTFEVIYFCILLSLFWVPLLTPRLFRFAYRFWAIFPLVLAGPYQFGYGYLFDHPHVGTFFQGLLYPVLLEHLNLFFNWSSLITGNFFIPHVNVLEQLNQPVVLHSEDIGEYVYTLGAVFISLATWLIGRWLSKKAFPVKRKDGVIPSERDDQGTPQADFSDKRVLPDERTAE